VTDVLKQLRPASFRGIGFPASGVRDFGFSQDQAQHRFIFRDEQLIESLGRQNPTFRFSIPFREDIALGPWKNLFTEVYPRFLAACQDRSAGILVDPIHGSVRVKCASFSEMLDATKRDGVDISVDFVFSPESADDVSSQFQFVASSIQGAVEQANRFDSDALTLSPDVRARVALLQSESPTARTDIFTAVRSVSDQVNASRNKVSAQLQDAAYKMERTRDSIDEARNPQLAPLKRDAARLELAAKSLDEAASRPPRPFRKQLALEPIGRMAFATRHQVSIDDLIAFNPDLANVFIIPAGYAVNVPRRDG
jgi:prophage DNA circulation protein